MLSFLCLEPTAQIYVLLQYLILYQILKRHTPLLIKRWQAVRNKNAVVIFRDHDPV